MKKRIGILLVLALVLLSLAACGEEKTKLEDISNSVVYSAQGGFVTVTGFEGDAQHISLPETIEGEPVGMITDSFAENKTLKTVELPQSINAFARVEGKLVLCASTVDNSVLLDSGNQAAVFCKFFQADEITVNGVACTVSSQPPEESLDLSGEWKNTDIIAGVRHTQVYTFADGKVTCDAEGDIFEGTYSFKNEKLCISLGGVTVEFEVVGDMLICWEQNITLSTKDLLDDAQTADSGWSYILTKNGNAQLTGYHGEEAVVEIPSYVDGYEVSSIHSCVADTYDFTNITFRGHGGIDFVRNFGWLYYDEATGAYILYSDASDNDYLGDIRIVNLEDKSYGSMSGGNYVTSTSGKSGSFTAAVYCRFFKQPKIVIDGKEYASPVVTDVTEEKLLGMWHHQGDQYHVDMVISIYGSGVAELHYMGGEYEEDCVKCYRGQYKIVKDQVHITFEKGTLSLDFIENKGICWRGNAWTSAPYPEEIALDFHKYSLDGREFLIPPFLHISQYMLLDTYIVEPQARGENKNNYLKFAEDGTAVVTINLLGWKDKTVKYYYLGSTVILTDDTISEILTVDDFWLTDGYGHVYYPSWLEE